MMMSFKTSQTDPSVIFGYFQEVKSLLSAVNVATLLTALAACRLPPPGNIPTDRSHPLVSHPVFREILETMVSRHVRNLDGFGVASVASSLARLGVGPQDQVWDILSGVLLLGASRPLRLEPQSVAALVQAYSKTGLAPVGLFESLEKAAMTKLHLFTPLALANLAAGFHKMGKGSPDLQRMLVMAATARLGEAELKDLPLIAMNFARASASAGGVPSEQGTSESPAGENEETKSGASAPTLDFGKLPPTDGRPPLSPLRDLFVKIEQQALGRVAELDTAGIISLAWGFARGDYRSEPLFREVSEAIRGKIPGMRPQDLSNICWAFAKVEVRAPEVMKRVKTEVVSRRTAFEPRHLSNIAWASSKLDFRSEALFSALSLEAKGKLDKFTPLGLVNLIAAFAKLKIYDGSLSRKVEGRSLELIDKFNPSELALLAWSFGEVTAQEHPGMATQADFNFDVLPLNRRGLFRKIALHGSSLKPHFKPVHWETLTAALASVRYPETL